ncbi:MAG TPA: trypsin-like peptidase domain-containing protein [bacterium]|jgi:S1-C subfamily serine protease|nr:trypsin-like peptidase domain-containing protein [bacterium]
MSKGKKRIILFVSIAIFILVFFPVFKYNWSLLRERSSEIFSGIFRESGLFKEKEKKYEGPVEIVNQKIVQEESETISVVDKVSPAVVSIVVKTTDFDIFSGFTDTYESGIGTGFIVDSNGLIITNSHVVNDPNGEYSVVLKDGTTYSVDKIHLDEYSDIAILEITARNLPTVEFGDSDSLKVGQKAIAIGNALGRFDNTVTVGVISGTAREVQASSGFGQRKTYENVIQTDAALNPGNSGGPLLNSSGQVIGVNVATTLGAENIGFAIPVNVVKPILASFIEKGKIVRPYLGVSYVLITKELAKSRNMPEGAYVSSVMQNSPADKAGLKRGDIILKVNNEKITGENTLSKVISTLEVGDKVTLTIDRSGKELTISATLAEMPND